MNLHSTTQRVLALMRRWFARPGRETSAVAATPTVSSTTTTTTSTTETRTARPVKVWDDRLSNYRTVDLNNPEDPLWLMAYHVHAVGKGMQTGPAF